MCIRISGQSFHCIIMEITKSDFGFKHPSTILISGPTQSGKTLFVSNILEQKLITPFPTRIVYVYKDWQTCYDKLKLRYPHIEFIQGYKESLYGDFDPLEKNLLVIDDQMEGAGNSDSLSTLFTVGSHHRNLTILYLVQNQFSKGKSTRAVSLNTHYNVLFRNNGDLTQTDVLFRRRGPQIYKWLSKAFDDATKKPYGYLVLDNRQDTPSHLRVRSGILKEEIGTIYEDAACQAMH